MLQMLGNWSFSLFVVSVILVVASTDVRAQTVDTTPPVIELEELIEGVADLSQVFTVQIAEESTLQDATLYYRRAGEQPYLSAPMEPLGNSGYYSVTIETDPNDLRAIEYYVQARDEAGNRSVSGYAFEPYVRSLRIADPITQSTEIDSGPEPEPAPPSLLQNRWVQIGLGILAVGITASLLDDDDGDDRLLVPVSINIGG
ncbi:MAG: hypothetical protein KTR32_15765 [Granulosicoccus sp.]|nr:hypothetical protein [Granulosicoccus sp.]